MVCPLGYSGAIAIAIAVTVLAASDFISDVKILKKACFGSTGCNVTYQIDPAYIGTSPLAKQTFTVIYEVSDGEDGPQIINFTANGDSRRSRPERP